MNASSLGCLGLTVLLIACTGDRPAADPTANTALHVHATQRSALLTVAGDTLSDSARVLEIHPEQDGDALVTLFADPMRQVSAGLAIIDRQMAAPQLLWPDSVTSIWWTGPHMLAFTTSNGNGIRLVVDIHAAKMRIADTSAAVLTKPTSPPSNDSALIERARSYTDSIHTQVNGVAQASSLTYSVIRLVPSPDGRLATFHTAARDAQNSLVNPAWYVLDRESGTVTSIDQVTGPVRELPERAGGWSQSGSFFYAKGRALWEAEIARAAKSSP